MSASPPSHMSPDEFRRHGRAAVEWIASYMERVQRGEWPVLSQVRPGEVRAKLPDDPPQGGEPFENMLRDLDEIIMPGITHWQSPSFFGYFPANASGPAILGELLSAGLGVQGMLWATSPACTELETHVLDWLARMLDLPERFTSSSSGGGVIQDTASSATLCAIIAARERATLDKSNEGGSTSNLVAYCSTQAHSSIKKGVKVAGIGPANLRFIEVDDRFAMNPHALDEQIEQDTLAGHKPFFVCATLGTTSSNAIDSIQAIGEVYRRRDVWLHVDAAMSGAAAMCPEFRFIHDGLDLADSYCFNPHKWMLTNFDCDAFYVADRASLLNALSILPEYLRNRATESGTVIDYRDWQIPLGRRFRALKLWFVVRYYGIDGLQAHVRHHVQLAREFASWVKADPRFELAVEPALNLVCFRLAASHAPHAEADAANEALLERINATGKVFLTHTRLAGRFTLRLAIGATHTGREHVERAWRVIQEAAL